MKLLEKAVRLGSVDAMVRLGEWYDLSAEFKGGANAEFAFTAFTDAAEKGSPNAMYYLGMIYKYGLIEDLSTGGIRNYRKKTHVQYAVPINEQKAFEWFSKSIQPNYRPSIFTIGAREFGRLTSGGSYFEKDAYNELAEMYRKGKVVAKDKQKAKELEAAYKLAISNYDKVWE